MKKTSTLLAAATLMNGASVAITTWAVEDVADHTVARADIAIEDLEGLESLESMEDPTASAEMTP